LAQQSVWQAGVPIAVHVDYDVPAYGAKDEAEAISAASYIEYEVAQRRSVRKDVAGLDVRG